MNRHHPWQRRKTRLAFRREGGVRVCRRPISVVSRAVRQRNPDYHWCDVHGLIPFEKRSGCKKPYCRRCYEESIACLNR